MTSSYQGQSSSSLRHLHHVVKCLQIVRVPVYLQEKMFQILVWHSTAPCVTQIRSVYLSSVSHYSHLTCQSVLATTEWNVLETVSVLMTLYVSVTMGLQVQIVAQ